MAILLAGMLMLAQAASVPQSFEDVIPADDVLEHVATQGPVEFIKLLTGPIGHGQQATVFAPQGCLDPRLALARGLIEVGTGQTIALNARADGAVAAAVDPEFLPEVHVQYVVGNQRSYALENCARDDVLYFSGRISAVVAEVIVGTMVTHRGADPPWCSESGCVLALPTRHDFRHPVLRSALAASLMAQEENDPDVGEPEPEEAQVPFLSPYDYLYAVYPGLARRMDCVIVRESRWDPGAYNRSSGAAGLLQFLLGTWLSTPQGKAGASRYDPYAAIDGAAWLITHDAKSWRHWSPVLFGMC